MAKKRGPRGEAAVVVEALTVGRLSEFSAKLLVVFSWTLGCIRKRVLILGVDGLF